MFNKHQPIIAKHAMGSPKGLASVYRFVLATIQQPLYMTPEICKSFAREGPESRFAFGFKADALHWLIEREGELYDNVVNLWSIPSDPESAARDVLAYLALCPGLGPVKAGFLCQLALGRIGCLDTHNITRYGLTPSAFKAARFKNAKTPKTRSRMIESYADTCLALGGAEGLWDSWCEYVARDVQGAFRYAHDPEIVSRYHLEALELN